MARQRAAPGSEARTPKVLTVAEISRYLRVHPTTVYRLVRRGQIPAFRIGSDWRFNIEVIERWQAELERTPSAAAAKRGPRRRSDITVE